ncbi:outer membrane protein assembly factor BamB family protein [Edaphobacter albus]|uniref:outer membrane protein assembly factor BamB family protein n=1 Tax=Edaphobacter sp. 4G125 TaxID=2763071 RepID=UPI00164815F7|nr:PQQ-binding-like beta-propeller repeat protein [Edaphobacter sp. 4G125]QNI35917.1 PQQ-binding-like beta-propeller repeat protein [Edaphobacter sp. 4G125]
MEFWKCFGREHRLSVLLTSSLALTAVSASAQTYNTWREYGGSADGAQYSSLRQINRANVSKLQQAWTFSTGDSRGYVFNPLVIGRTMYVLAHNNSVVALDAATGKELWSQPLHAKTLLITNRGLNYWQSKDGKDRRLIFAVDNALRELDATTGKPIESFGVGGRVDLREGLGRNPESLTLVQSYNPGRIYGDLLILGSATNEEYASGPGDIRAYNVLTGKMEWIFHTIPHPGEPGYETWPKDAWKSVGGANDWSSMALDEKRGIVFVPTASPKYNFYGANRPGKNLYGDSLLALNARTGKLIWYYQMVHHDIWDYDNATTPQLLTVRQNGRMVDAVVVANKEGFVWAFERTTGKPLWPIEERPVPKSDMPGEETWPTQPFPTKPAPFARQSFTAKDLSPFLEPAERESLLKQMAAARNGGLFTPPSTTDTVEMPGNNGGANYGGSAIDPVRGYFYVVSKDLPAMLKLTLAAEPLKTGTSEVRGRSLYEANCSLCHGDNRAGKPPAIPSLAEVSGRLSDDEIRKTIRSGKGAMPSFGQLKDPEIDALLAYLAHPERAPETVTAPAQAKPVVTDPIKAHYRSSFGFMFAESGLPVIAPPWTTLTAYDLNSGDIRWQIPLGEVPELAAKGIKNTGSHFPKINPVVTAGGLIFTGSRDRKIRALDSSTGKVLWETEVDAALEGMPAVYEIDGREYVVFCAAARSTTHTHAIPGHPASTDPIRGAYVAFALPTKETTKQ